jgi:glycosyltransferase involved in cell wall biosynthesis
VGDLHARRNLLTALDAFCTEAADRDLDFVFIGRDLGARAEIQQHARNLGCQDRLHFLQDVPLDQMPHWYRNAALMVYPSLYEGFGLPLLEAMQCGCPVVASRAASIPEVVGDAAWLVDPMSVREIAEGIRAILTQPETRERLIQKGLQRVKQFSWKKTAENTVGVYRRVLQSQTG